MIVVGGSLYGDAGNIKWSPASSACQNKSLGSDEYCAKRGSGTNALSSVNYQPSLSQTVPNSDKHSWKIHVADKHSNGQDDSKQGIDLCGNWNCDPARPTDSLYVYIRLHDQSTSRWEGDGPYTDGNLYFQDAGDDCKASYGSSKPHEGKCEHASKARLFIGGSSKPRTKSKCTAPSGSTCYVGVGQQTDQK